MSIGTNQASTFRFQPRQAAIGPRDIIARGLQAEQELYGGPGPQTPELPEDMAQIQDVTTELQNQWFEAKNFANTMWHNYRIDVTKPDSRNPLSVQANQAYLKALAGIQNAGLKLKEYNKQLGLTDKAVAEGRGMYVQDPRKSYMQDPNDYFASTTQDDAAMQGNQYNAGRMETSKAYGQALPQQTELRNKYIEAAKAAEASGDLGLAATYRDKANQVNNPKLEIPYQATSDWLDRKAGADKEEVDIFNEVEVMRKGLVNRDPNVVDRFKSIISQSNGGRPVSVRQIFKDGKLGYLIIKNTPDGDKQTERVVFDDEDGGMRRINDYLNVLVPSKYKVETNRMVEYYKKAKEAGITTDDLPSMNIGSEFDANLMLAYSMFENKDTKTKRGGKENIITKQHKNAFYEMLDDLALQNKLIDYSGDNVQNIVDVEWKNGKLYFYPEQIYEGQEPDPIEVDTSTKKGQNKIKELLENNYEYIIDNPATTPLGPTEKIGTVTKAGNLNLDDQSVDAKLKMFEDWKKSKQ